MGSTKLRAQAGTKDVALKADASTNSLQVIDYAHHEIHGGSHYFVVYSVASLDAMEGPDDMITLSWTTPNTEKWAHFNFSVKGTAGWRVRLIENSTTGGTTGATGTVSILNSDRNSTGASGMLSWDTGAAVAAKMSYDASLAESGAATITLIDEYIFGDGRFSSGAESGGRDEIILKQNTNYQVSVYGAAADAATLHLTWYEHTNAA